MTVVYPKEFEKNAPKLVKVIFGFEGIEISGLYDEFFIIVKHEEESADLNYTLGYDGTNNLHFARTRIDCRYPSKNLDLLISKFCKIEEIWNNE